MIEKPSLPVASAIDPTGPRTIATEIGSLDLRLGELIRQAAAAPGYVNYIASPEPLLAAQLEARARRQAKGNRGYGSDAAGVPPADRVPLSHDDLLARIRQSTSSLDQLI